MSQKAPAAYVPILNAERHRVCLADAVQGIDSLRFA